MHTIATIKIPFLFKIMVYVFSYPTNSPYLSLPDYFLFTKLKTDFTQYFQRSLKIIEILKFVEKMFAILYIFPFSLIDNLNNKLKIF